MYLPESSRESFGDDDRWYNAYMLDCALQSGTIATPLATELYRIHTCRMPWVLQRPESGCVPSAAGLVEDACDLLP